MAYSNGCDRKINLLARGNLVQDPSFESQYYYWQAANVLFTNSSPYEGAIQARLGPGVASLAQNVSVKGAGDSPLFFSFNAFSTAGLNGIGSAGILIAEILWLDDNYNTIGTGLRMLVPGDRLNQTARITFFAQTDRPPTNAAYARILFSKGQGALLVPGEADIGSDFLYIDNVVLAPMAGANLLQNGDFEANLFSWTAVPGNDTAFLSSYKESLAGAGHAQTHYTGTLTQDIDIRHLPTQTSFLLAFGVAGTGPVGVTVRVEWLNAYGVPIGSGLNLSIPSDTLANQENYLTYLNVTFPTVAGTATARLTFGANVPNPAYFVRLDQVIFAPVRTTNLVSNPSFEDGLNGWNQSLVNLIERNDVYEGRFDAGLGEIGGALWQDIPLYNAEGNTYLFGAGLGFRRTSPTATFGTFIMQVIWLDRYDRELGVGLNLIVNAGQFEYSFLKWVPYVGVTDPAPAGTAKARVLFSKTDSSQGYIEVDNVVLAQLSRNGVRQYNNGFGNRIF